MDLLLNHLFEIANEDELPETWVEAPPATTRMVLGRNCHNGWRLADPATPVSDIVLWLVHQRKERYLATIVRMAKWLWRNMRYRTPRPARLSISAELGSHVLAAGSDAGGGAARADATAKRFASAAGLIGVYAVWAIMSWFIFVRACCIALHHTAGRSDRRPRAAPLQQVYGALIYRNLGPSAETEFAKTWGIGYGLDSASEWQEVLKTALQAALIVVVMDALRLSRGSKWCVGRLRPSPADWPVSHAEVPRNVCRFEEHIDFMSMQCLLYDGVARSWWQQTRKLVKLQERLVD